VVNCSLVATLWSRAGIYRSSIEKSSVFYQTSWCHNP